MTKKQHKNNNRNQVVWILDECVTQNKNKWEGVLSGNVKSVKELGLLSTKDAIISKTLDAIISKGKVVITTNKHPDKCDDYFKISSVQGLIRFSSDMITQPEQKIYLEKFQQMVKNKTKLLGKKITLTKNSVIFEEGNKKEVRNYKQYI